VIGQEQTKKEAELCLDTSALFALIRPSGRSPILNPTGKNDEERKRTLHNQLQMVSQPTVLLAAHTNEPLLWLLRRETEKDEGISRQNRHDSGAPTLPEMKAHGRNASLASAPTSHAGWVAAQLASSSHQPGLQKRLLRRPPAELPAKRASQLPGQPSRPQLPPRISMRYAG